MENFNSHGVGLAILTPRWMRHVLQKSPDKVILRFAHFPKFYFEHIKVAL